MKFAGTAFSEHLHSLVSVKSEQELESLLQLLWRTRKSGLSAPQKSSLQSLLNLPSSAELDPKHERRWKDELSKEQNVLVRSKYSNQTNGDLLTRLTPLTSSDISRGSFLPMQVNPVPIVNEHNLGRQTPITAESENKVTSFPQPTLQNNAVSHQILGVVPRLKSMTWTVDNKRRVAIITLKLQDYTESPLNQTEVKFQLTRDTLDAVLDRVQYRCRRSKDARYWFEFQML